MRRGCILTQLRKDGVVREVKWSEGGVICLRPATPRLHTIISGGDVAYSYSAITATAFGGVDAFSLYNLPDVLVGADAAEASSEIEASLLLDSVSDAITRGVCRRSVAHNLGRILLRQSTIKPDAGQRVQGIARVSPALEYLAAHFAEPPDIAALASLCCLSPSRFHTVFRQATGGTPYDALTRHRLERASHLLVTTELGIAEVGESVGWGDPFHFSRTFKSHYGVSPRAHRVRARAGLAVL
jgi:AraC-like DNA-binding protein